LKSEGVSLRIMLDYSPNNCSQELDVVAGADTGVWFIDGSPPDLLPPAKALVLNKTVEIKTKPANF